VRIGISLGSLAASQILAGLIGQLVVLRIIGVGATSDAYIASQAVPVVVTAVVASALQSLWLPRFSRLAADQAALRSEIASALGQTSKILLGITAALLLSLPVWGQLAFPGFDAAQLTLLESLSPPLFAASICNAISGIFTASLRARNEFIRADVSPLLGSLASIGLYASLVPQFGVTGAAWIAFARATCVLIAQWNQARRPGLQLRVSAASVSVWQKARPMMGAALFIKSSPLVDRYWSSQGLGGEVTILSLAQLGINSLAMVLERAILTPVAPDFSRHLARGDIGRLRASYHRIITKAALAALAVGALLLALRPAWSDLLLAALRTPQETADQIYWACLLLLPSLFSAVSASSAAAVFYAFGETRLPTLIGIWGFAASLVLKAILFLAFGVLGLAAGASLYVMLVLLLYHIAVSRRLTRALLDQGTSRIPTDPE